MISTDSLASLIGHELCFKRLFLGRCCLWPGDERDHTCLARLFIFLFGRWLTNPEISDPYGKSDEAFTHVHRQLVNAAEAWAGKL